MGRLRGTFSARNALPQPHLPKANSSIQAACHQMKRFEDEIYTRVRILMECDHLYLDPHLTLKKLSTIVGTNTLYLSKAINHCTGHNFRTMLNDYRIEHAKQLIRQSPSEVSVRELYKECAYVSASVFHIAFKERTNTTPMQYLRNCLREEAQRELERRLRLLEERKAERFDRQKNFYGNKTQEKTLRNMQPYQNERHY